MSLAIRLSFLAAGILAVSLTGGGRATAQGVFCPASILGQSASPSAGTCTNASGVGAFSGAALGSQALSDLTQSTTQEITDTAIGAISERRAHEAAACEPGLVRVDGVCQPAAAEKPSPPRAPAPTAEANKKKQVHPQKSSGSNLPREHRAPPARSEEVTETPPPGLPTFKGPPPVPYGSGYNVGAWAHGYGDYERRTGTSSSTLSCCRTTTGVDHDIPLVIDARSNTTTGGVLGGIDLTARSLLSGGDGLIVGVLGGYMSSDVRVRTSILSTEPANAMNGFGNVKVTLSGPSAGIYATYFNGPFSNDFLLKNDFLDLHETTSQLLAFAAEPNIPPFTGPFTEPFVGAGSTHLNQFTLSDNLNYRFALLPDMWIEPTAGIQYTLSSYGGSAALLGLKDGYLVRLQGGARFGFESLLGGTRMTATLTGLLYDDVVVHGDFIQGGAFGLASNALKDEGKLRAEGILAFNFDLGHGVSTFVEGQVRGGQGLFGAGGKAGIESSGDLGGRLRSLQHVHAISLGLQQSHQTSFAGQMSRADRDKGAPLTQKG